MAHRKTIDRVLSEILRTRFDDFSSADFCDKNVFSKALRMLGSELLINLNLEVFDGELGLDSLADFIERRPSNRSTGGVFDVYEKVEEIARQEFHPDIRFGWASCWDDFFETGNWLTKPDPLDAYEMQLRLEDEFNLEFTESDLEKLGTVGATVRFVWLHSPFI